MAGVSPSRKASFPITAGNGVVLATVPPVDFYASQRDAGTTANRPASPGPRRRYYDTDLGETIYWNAGRARWEDFIGNQR